MKNNKPLKATPKLLSKKPVKEEKEFWEREGYLSYNDWLRAEEEPFDY